MTARAAIVAREAGTVAGVRAAELAFRLLDPAMACEVRAPDGATVSRGQVVMQLDGSARALLSAERTALNRSEEHTSELQSLMRISYAVFRLKKKKKSLRILATINSHTRPTQR